MYIFTILPARIRAHTAATPEHCICRNYRFAAQAYTAPFAGRGHDPADQVHSLSYKTRCTENPYATFLQNYITNCVGGVMTSPYDGIWYLCVNRQSITDDTGGTMLRRCRFIPYLPQRMPLPRHRDLHGCPPHCLPGQRAALSGHSATGQRCPPHTCAAAHR